MRACAVEEATSGAYDGFVNAPLTVIADDFQVAVFAAMVKPALEVRATHDHPGFFFGTHADSASKSSCSALISCGEDDERAIGMRSFCSRCVSEV